MENLICGNYNEPAGTTCGEASSMVQIIVQKAARAINGCLWIQFILFSSFWCSTPGHYVSRCIRKPQFRNAAIMLWFAFDLPGAYIALACQTNNQQILRHAPNQAKVSHGNTMPPQPHTGCSRGCVRVTPTLGASEPEQSLQPYWTTPLFRHCGGL